MDDLTDVTSFFISGFNCSFRAQQQTNTEALFAFPVPYIHTYIVQFRVAGVWTISHKALLQLLNKDKHLNTSNV